MKSSALEDLFFVHELLFTLGELEEKRTYTPETAKLCYFDMVEHVSDYLDIDFIFSEGREEEKEFLLVYYGEHLSEYRPEQKETFCCTGNSMKALFDNWKKKVAELIPEHADDIADMEVLEIFEFLDLFNFQDKAQYFVSDDYYYASYLKADYEQQKSTYPTIVGVFDAAPPHHEEAFLILGKYKR